ncbi:MAG: helix-turn-helix domain-containing protein [Planctomycetia bacterium]|nr:helix-turn-helix domain-containing protein [Planctomycetia bacterium]
MSVTEALLLNATQAAELLAICPKTLFNLTAPRGPIRPVRLGRAVRYSRASLEQFVAQRQEATT